MQIPKVRKLKFTVKLWRECLYPIRLGLVEGFDCSSLVSLSLVKNTAIITAVHLSSLFVYYV